jgi:hypothetical protein
MGEQADAEALELFRTATGDLASRALEALDRLDGA